MINENKTWGSKFIENLAADIRISFPNVKGYSVRNLKYMAKFAETYPDEAFVQQAVAQIPWGTLWSSWISFRTAPCAIGILRKLTSCLPEDLSKQLPSVEDIQKRIGN